MTENQEKLEQLRAPFPATAISKLPRGGAALSYVGHAAVTDRLLSVDPFWTWEPVAWDSAGFPAIQGSPDGKLLALWIRLTVCGVTRLGVGTCPSSKAEVLKELIGDALRNAAMRFGVALDLWTKDELESAHIEPGEGVTSPPAAKTPPPTQQNSAHPPAETAATEPPLRADGWADDTKPEAPATRPQMQKLMALCNEQKISDEQRRDIAGVDSFTTLTKGLAGKLIEKLQQGDLTPWAAAPDHPLRAQVLEQLALNEPNVSKRREYAERAKELVITRILAGGQKPGWELFTVEELRALLAHLQKPLAEVAR